MRDIRIISASAGSGKTYQLAEELKDAILAGDTRPEAVIATTFTRKAAAELQQRVRTHLLKSKQPAEAQRLNAARIGTVDAVCLQIVKDFAFELGLSPEVDVLDEDTATATLALAIDEVASGEDLLRLEDLESRLMVIEWGGKKSWDWKGNVGTLIELVRSNGIKETSLSDHAERSKAEMLSLLGKPVKDGKRLDKALQKALETFIPAAQAQQVDFTKATKDALALAETALFQLQRGQDITWKDWASLADLKPSTKLSDVRDLVREAAARHDNHPRLRADLVAAIDLVYKIASRALARYQRRKEELGRLDYGDLEAYTLELLGKKEVRARLREQVDLVLVDEFQDTNPLQLAIFLGLAGLAKRSIWVGDQKQSIYGFRGADPVLMDTVIDTILAGEDPTTLGESWRSRPELVKLTSDLFAPPFEQQDIPAKRTRLTAAKKAIFPKGLGPCLEHWRLTSSSKENDHKSIAAGVQQLLADKKARVRDPSTTKARRPTARDVAVLAYYNDDCKAIATELEALGIAAVIPRDGLLDTLEGLLLMAGLQLWVDPGDRLAAAQFTRLVDYADRPNQWLQALLSRDAYLPFADNERIQALRELPIANLGAGVVEAFDSIAATAGIRELCHRWGNTDARLANIESLRSYVVAYAGGADPDGAAITHAGLQRYLEDNAESQGRSRQGNAVTVSSWHAAKGLEWPITVLYPFPRQSKITDVMGAPLVVESGRKPKLTDPLANRWIRYWIYPYASKGSEVPLMNRLDTNPEALQQQARSQREELRQLYVVWTRARDRLVIAARPKYFLSKKQLYSALTQLNITETPIITEPEPKAKTITWAGNKLPIVARAPNPIEDPELETQPALAFPIGEPAEYPPAYTSPTARARAALAEPVASTAASLDATIQLGKRLPITGKPEWLDIGNALHGFFAADRPTYAKGRRLALAKRIMDAYAVAPHMTPDTMLTAADRLYDWLRTEYPTSGSKTPQWHREHRISAVDDSGTTMRGAADFIVDTGQGFVVIDHKAFPGSPKQATTKAAQYAAQLDAYKWMLNGTQADSVSATYIHLPVSGVIVQIGK